MEPARKRGSDGMSAVEVLVSLVIFSIVATGLGAAMVQANNWLSSAKVESGANNIAQGMLDNAKRMPYSDVGVVGGNPEGTLLAAEDKIVGGLTYKLTREITYVDDSVGPGAKTEANYKKIVVTVDPPGLGKTVTQTTILAPPDFATIDGKALIKPTVVDDFDDSKIEGVTVTLTRIGGGSALTRNATTSALGTASFPSLDPNTGSTQYKLTFVKAGFALKTGQTLTRALVGGETWRSDFRLVRLAAAKASLRDTSGQPYARPANVSLVLPAPAGPVTPRATSTGTTTFTGFAASPSAFTVSAVSADGCDRAAAVSSPIAPNETHEFVLVMQPGPALTVSVRDTAGNPVPDASVRVGTTNAKTGPNGDVNVCVPVGEYPITAFKTGYGPSAATVTRTVPATASAVTLRLAPGAATCAVTIRGVAGTEGRGVEVYAEGYYANPATGPTHQIIDTLSPTDRTYTAPGLIPGVPYHARLKDAGGIWSATGSAAFICATAGETVDATSPEIAP